MRSILIILFLLITTLLFGILRLDAGYRLSETCTTKIMIFPYVITLVLVN